jgi:hypothetical protein
MAHAVVGRCCAVIIADADAARDASSKQSSLPLKLTWLTQA